MSPTPEAPAPETIELDSERGRFNALAWGDRKAPVTLCLHGFPDHPASFEPLAGELAARGRRVVAPFARGYAPTPPWPASGAIDLEALADDVIAQVSACGARSLVAHDWGAVAAWFAAPDLGDLDALAMLAIPHPLALIANIARSPAQLWRSRYMAQLAASPDRLADDDFAFARVLWRRWSPGYRLSDDQWEALRSTLAAAHPHPALYYRALFRPAVASTVRRLRRSITAPVLSIFGADDGCFSPAMCRGQERFVSGRYEAVVIAGAGHFVHLERPAEVAAALTR